MEVSKIVQVLWGMWC